MALAFGAPAGATSQQTTKEHVTTIIPRGGNGDVLANEIIRRGVKTNVVTESYSALTEAPDVGGDVIRTSISSSNEDFSKLTVETENYS